MIEMKMHSIRADHESEIRIAHMQAALAEGRPNMAAR